MNMQNVISDLTSYRVVFFVIAAIAGYLVGSLNLAIVMSRGMGKDIREMGSGNAGTTNTLRTMGKGAAVMVLLFDILKGSLVPLILLLAKDALSVIPFIDVHLCNSMAYLYAFFAVVGHCFPIYYKFRGGKGIATAAGALLVINPVATLAAICEFAIVLILFRYVSLASIMAVINIPIFTYLMVPGEMRLFATTIAIAVLALVKHASNVKRIREGKESSFTLKSDKKKELGKKAPEQIED